MVKTIKVNFAYAHAIVNYMCQSVCKGYTDWEPANACNLYRVFPCIKGRDIPVSEPIEYGIIPEGKSTPVWFNFKLGEDNLVHATVSGLKKPLETSFDPAVMP